MSKSDRLCIKVALWPALTFVSGLLGLMVLRVVSGGGPLPAGSGPFVLGLGVLVTFGAVVAAHLLRFRLAR